jgi:hypothetical protein
MGSIPFWKKWQPNTKYQSRYKLYSNRKSPRLKERSVAMPVSAGVASPRESYFESRRPVGKVNVTYQKAALRPETMPIWFNTTRDPLFLAGATSLPCTMLD